MEGESVDGPYVVDVVYCLSMAFECVLLVLNFRSGVNVFYRNPSFDRGRGVTCNQCQGARWEPKRSVPNLFGHSYKRPHVSYT